MTRKRITTICPVLFGGALFLSACGGSPQEALMDPTVTVKTAPVSTGSLSSDSIYIGTISAEGTATVISQVSAAATALYVSVGDHVEAGQLLCEFDDTAARLSLENALASYGGEDLSLLTTQLSLAEKQYNSILTLAEIGAVSQADVDQAHQSLLSAQTALEGARASVAAARYQVSLYQLTSPISGMVEAVNVTVNNFTSSGTAAFIISNAENKTVTFYVTDTVRQALTPGQEVTVSYGDRTYSGSVTEISGVVDASAGLFQIKAVISGAQDLPDGLSVELSTRSYSVENAVIIPCDALYFEDGEAYVYLAEEGLAVRRPVEVALYTSEQAALSSGISAGDELITTWSSSLKDGASIQIVSGGDAANDPTGGEQP